MRKNSPNSSRDGKPGPGNFKRNSDSKPGDKGGRPFKKNYDGRGASQGDGKRPARPYSGRGADGDGAKRSYEDRPARSDAERRPGDRPYDRPKRSFDDKRESSGKRPFEKRDDDRKPRTGDRPYDKPKRSFDDKRESSGKRPFEKRDEGGAFGKPRAPKDSRPFRDRPKTAFDKKNVAGAPKPEAEERKFESVIKNAFNSPKKKVSPDEEFAKPKVYEDQVFGALEEPVEETFKLIPPRKGASKKSDAVPVEKIVLSGSTKGRRKKYKEEDEDEEDEEKKIKFAPGSEDLIPLNKYIAHSGECSRRDAAELVRQGKVKVNGELILEPGHKVRYDDNVTLVGKKLRPQKDNVYILLNKPKGYITTNEDPQGRKTVMDLVTNSGADRIFPVGRLDRDTSGLLLITNDGELTQKLCHPSFNIKKVYQVTLDKPLTKAHFEEIIAGVELEDGKAIVDEIAYLESKNELGLEIHSGKNRIVRRIFESLGYVVEKLDRVMYAGLTKKNLPRGKWRFLDPREVVLLKHFKS